MNGPIRKRKPLTVRPLKSSPTVGAVLAFQGMAGAMPILHGSQGCSAFTKVMFVRHFREPIAIQTTAMDQTSTIMGGDDHLIEALDTVAAKHHPALIGVVSTGLTALPGSDLNRAIKQFRADYPQWRQIPVIPVQAPDFAGSMSDGHAAAVMAMIDQLVQARPWQADQTLPMVNVLASSTLTPGDLEEIADLLEALGLQAVFLPDLAASLDGHLADGSHGALTSGGTPLTFFNMLHRARATLVIGHPLFPAAELLQSRCPMPVLRFDHLMGLDACDRLVSELIPFCDGWGMARIERWRRQLLDAMLDTHFYLGLKRVALAGEAELLLGFRQLLAEMGAVSVACVVPEWPSDGQISADESWMVGDLDDLERLAGERAAQLLIGGSPLEGSARRLKIPLHRAGYPIFDRLGEFRRVRVGYRGARDTLFELANLLLAHQPHGIPPSLTGPRRSELDKGASNDDGTLQHP